MNRQFRVTWLHIFLQVLLNPQAHLMQPIVQDAIEGIYKCICLSFSYAEMNYNSSTLDRLLSEEIIDNSFNHGIQVL
jgi:hypothetical protein